MRALVRHPLLFYATFYEVFQVASPVQFVIGNRYSPLMIAAFFADADSGNVIFRLHGTAYARS